jgi:DUF4097 and DUF4098 domain-containing protein YvlB
MLKTITSITSALILCGCVVHVSPSAANADIYKKKTLQLDAATFENLTAKTGAGSLEIVGEKDRTNIVVNADIYTVEEGDYTLTLTKSGNKAFLEAKVPSLNGNVWRFGSNGPRIDLVIKMPSELALKLDDGSGSIDIEGLTSHLTIEDGSGSLAIDGGKSLNLKDGSGSLTVKNIMGKTNIDDGSGSMSVENIQGDLVVDDGSGSLEIKNVTGNATIEDGSGGLTVRKVSGKVTIDDGSGGITVKDAGSLEIIDSGSGGVQINGIRGTVKVDD